VLLAEIGDSAWLLVSDDTEDALQRQAVPGDTVWAFVTIHGAVPGPAGHWVLTLDAFGTHEDLASWGLVLRSCR
jgi:hypothetical protein